MRYRSRESFLDTYWYSFNDEPVATRGSLLIPRLSDPSFLLPDESPDALWHLFAHTWQGVEHYVSSSGLEWEREHLVFFRGHSPFIHKEGNVYYLLYEIHDTERKRRKKEKLTGSRIMMSTSTDLALWSEPRMILDARAVPRASYRGGKPRVSRPQLIRWNDSYHLYFGAGETRIYDTGQKASAFFMTAESSSIDGPYSITEKPLIIPDGESRYRSLASGSVRVIPLGDALGAIECAYFYDEKLKRSRSAMMLMTSEDGISWHDEDLIQLSPEEGWASRCITSCDARYKENEETWYCYYSANAIDRSFKVPYVKESLGLLLGRSK